MNVLTSSFILAWLLALAGTAYGAAPVRIISDFEDEKPLAGWAIETGDVKLALSTARAKQGSRSLKLTYGQTNWRVAILNFASRGAQDWRGWDRLEFDMYVEGEHPIGYLRVLVEDRAKKLVTRSDERHIPTGQWLRYSTDLRRAPNMPDPFADLDRSRIGRLRLLAHSNHPFPADTVIYIDNVRLVSTAGERLERIAEQLGMLLRSRQLAGADTQAATRLARRVAELKKQLPAGPSEREQIVTAALEIEDELTRLAQLVVDRQLHQSIDSLADMIGTLGMTIEPSPGFPTSQANNFRGPTELEPGHRLRALERAAGLTDQLVQRRHQQAEIERQFAGQDFAIGIPRWPQAWRDDGYDGRIGGGVAIAAAANEFEPFQLVVLATQRELHNVRLEASPLSGPRGVISAEHIEIAPMGWRKLREGPRWLADMLRPDVSHFDVKAGGHQPVWVNVYVPPGTPAGRYQGTMTVAADGVNPQQVSVQLRVWPFALPRFASMPTATNWGQARRNLEHGRFILNHRWDPFQLYLNEPVPLAVMRQYTDWGARNHNLLRVDPVSMRQLVERDADGTWRVNEKARDSVFERLDPMIQQIRDQDPDFMQHVMIYGFDEPPTSQIPAMMDLYGQLKARYDGVRTMFATLHPVWEQYPELHHVDIVTVVLSQLTRESRDLLQAQGIEVWWHNLFSREDDAVGVRAQYWGTFKDQLDGMVYYALRYGGTGSGPFSGNHPWEPSLWPSTPRTDGGIVRGTADGAPISTTTFEYFREGMEDLEYLYQLRRRREALEAEGGRVPPDQMRRLLRAADRLIRVPDYVSTGILDDRVVEIDEVVVETAGHTKDMDVILATRKEIAELIVEIDGVLGERD